MKLSRTTAKIVALLCLLLFQAQLYASVSLGCRHTDEAVADASTSACPFHRALAGEDDTGGLDKALDCQKCALYLAVGGPLQISASASISVPPMRAVTEPSPGRHFYHFIPDPFSRPPIEPTA